MKIIKADNFFKKFKGFMFKKNISYGIYFSNVNLIHTFFMRCNIDIIGLDNNHIIKEIYTNVEPNKIVWLKKSNNTLEIPANCWKNLTINQKIDLDI